VSKSFHVEPPKTDGPDLLAAWTDDRLRSIPCNAGSRIRRCCGPDAAIPTHIGVFVLSRDRLSIEVKGLTAAPGAAVNGADFTPDEAAIEMRVPPVRKPFP
jgi:hypothetical protein